MKKFVIALVISIFPLYLIAQEVDASTSAPATEEITTQENTTEEITQPNIKGEEFHESESFLDFIQTLDFVMQFEPGINFNQHKTDENGKLISAPSPIIYPLSIGVLWPNYTFIATQPTVSYFMQHHLYYDGKALPAEIENRTTTTLSFMVNLPLVITLFIKDTRFQLSAGVGALLQFGLLSAGVSSNDSGYSGSAGSDVDLINKYFWNDLHWLYFTTGASYLYTFSNKVRVGPTFNVYFPVGTLINNKNIHGLIVSAGVKICR